MEIRKVSSADNKVNRDSKVIKANNRARSKVNRVSRDSKVIKASRRISRTDRIPAAAVRVAQMIVRAGTAAGMIAS